MLGAGPVSRRRVRGGPGIRRRHARRRLEQGLSSPRPASCMPTTTDWSTSCAATSTSTGACERRPDTSSSSISPASVRGVASAVAADRRWMYEHGINGGIDRTRWTTRAAAHHAGRRVFSALGSRADRLPRGLTRTLSLEGRGHEPAGRGPRSATRRLARRADRAPRPVRSSRRCRASRRRASVAGGPRDGRAKAPARRDDHSPVSPRGAAATTPCFRSSPGSSAGATCARSGCRTTMGR